MKPQERQRRHDVAPVCLVLLMGLFACNSGRGDTAAGTGASAGTTGAGASAGTTGAGASAGTTGAGGAGAASTSTGGGSGGVASQPAYGIQYNGSIKLKRSMP